MRAANEVDSGGEVAHFISYDTSPIHWASPSLIITAHATKPIVQCIQFPSNKTYPLPDPPSFQVSHISYEPPNIIAVSAKADYVFALFPSINGDNVGCIWTRGSLLNEWLVKDCRSFPRGDSVVSARWLDNEREVGQPFGGKLLS